MDTPKTMPPPPIGLAFEIADHLLLQRWAKSQDLQVLVELDHHLENEEYEEIVACYDRNSPLRRWIMWRGATDIVIQPLIGRSGRFTSVADALGSPIAARP
jgi:hypothetical protein